MWDNKLSCFTMSQTVLHAEKATGHSRRSILADKASQHASVFSLGFAYGHSSVVCQRTIPSKYPETWWVWSRRTCITSSTAMVRRSEVRPVWFVLIVVVFSLMRVGIRLNGWADEVVISNTWWRAWSERRKIGIGRYH